MRQQIQSDTEAQEKVRVYDKGAEPSADYDSYAALIALRQGDIWIPRIDGTEPLLLECQHFVDCVRESREPRTSGRDGLAVVEVLCAGQESMSLAGAAVALR